MPHNQHVQKLFQALNQAGGDEDSLVETRSTNSLVDMIADSTTNGKSIKPKKQQNGEINGGKRGRKAREPVKLNGNGTHHNGNHIKIPASFISQNSTTDYFDPTSASGKPILISFSFFDKFNFILKKTTKTIVILPTI